MIAIAVRGLRHTYRTADGPLTVLDGVDLCVPGGGRVALMGRSGAGKSTLLSVLGGLERPQDGVVLVGDEDLARLDGDRLAAYRRATVGFVFQHFGLLEALSAQENVELALTLAGLGARARRRRAADLLDAVGLGPRATHKPAALSGGERQRVAIARALANQPPLLLADEPTGNLDDEAGATVLDLLERMADEHGCTLVVVTHDERVAARIGRVVRIDEGRLIAA